MFTLGQIAILVNFPDDFTHLSVLCTGFHGKIFHYFHLNSSSVILIVLVLSSRSDCSPFWGGYSDVLRCARVHCSVMEVEKGLSSLSNDVVNLFWWLVWK